MGNGTDGNNGNERKDLTGSLEFKAAVEQYFRLVDSGVTKEKLAAFLGEYREQSPAFQEALLECIVLATDQPPECVKYAESLLGSERPLQKGLKCTRRARYT